MTIEIIYDHTRVRTTEYNYTILMDGDIVGCANTYHAAELVAQEIERREDIARLKGAIAALDEVDQAITAEIETLSAELTPNDYQPAFVPDPRGYADISPLKRNDSPECPCGNPALFFVQYPDRTYGYCPDCYREQSEGQPLLAQCAQAIRAVLGNVPANGGIIDELRRCDQALRREGW